MTTTEVNVESFADRAANSDDDTMEGCEETSEHIEGVDMTDAPVTSPLPVAAPQSRVFESTPSTVTA